MEVTSSGPATEAGGGILRDLLGWLISGPGLRLDNRLRTRDCWLRDRDFEFIADEVNCEAPPLEAGDDVAVAAFFTKGDEATAAEVVVEVVALVMLLAAAFLTTYFW